MAKNRRRKKPINKAVKEQAAESVVSTVPKFEIGVKGDEFDLKFTRAAAAKTAGADNLLRSLSKETGLSTYNLCNFAVLVLMILFLAMSFALLSRDGSAPRFSMKALSDGSYLSELSEYYKDTLPFGRALRTLGAYLGFGDMPEPVTSQEPVDGDPVPEVTTPTEPPEITTAPTTTDTPTSAPITEQTEMTAPETYIMYATGTLNVRLMPDIDSMIMGYFGTNEEVEVIELSDDGWASIWYNGMIAYASADYLDDKPVVTTRATRSTTVTTEETTEETTTTPEETDEITTTEEVTTTVETTTVSTPYTGPTGWSTTPTPPLTTPTPATTPEPTTAPPPTTTPEPATTPEPPTEPPAPTESDMSE